MKHLFNKTIFALLALLTLSHEAAAQLHDICGQISGPDSFTIIECPSNSGTSGTSTTGGGTGTGSTGTAGAGSTGTASGGGTDALSSGEFARNSAGLFSAEAVGAMRSTILSQVGLALTNGSSSATRLERTAQGAAVGGFILGPVGATVGGAWRATGSDPFWTRRAAATAAARESDYRSITEASNAATANMVAHGDNLMAAAEARDHVFTDQGVALEKALVFDSANDASTATVQDFSATLQDTSAAAINDSVGGAGRSAAISDVAAGDNSAIAADYANAQAFSSMRSTANTTRFTGNYLATAEGTGAAASTRQDLDAISTAAARNPLAAADQIRHLQERMGRLRGGDAISSAHRDYINAELNHGFLNENAS